MDSKSSSARPVGVIGAGSFGTAMANLLAQKSPVFLYARSQEVVDEMQATRMSNGQALHEGIRVTNDPKEVAEACEVIFPMVPSGNFREMIQRFAPYLHPYHLMIHGTKGLDTSLASEEALYGNKKLTRKHVRTMSEVIRQESVVVRIGCLAGPNLARELAEGKPAATVIASHFEEVIAAGQRLLRSDRFQVYGNNDLIGVELCGVLKNIIAIASGMTQQMDLGENARGLLISRGLIEMIYLGQAFGGNIKAFIGLAGVGDLVATSNSTTSRNFTVGRLLAQGKSLEEIRQEMEEVAEGVNTIKIAKKLAESVGMRLPITESLHRVLFGTLEAEEALANLMKYPFYQDVDFL